MNTTNNRGRGRPKKEVAPVEKQMNYMQGLSAMVNKACDEWLRGRGIGPQDWRTKKNADFKKRQGS